MSLTRSCLVAAAILVSAQSSAAPAKRVFPPMKGHNQYAGCPPQLGEAEKAEAIDLSDPIDDVTLQGAKQSGIKLIFRYYDWADDLSKPPPRGGPFTTRRTAFADANGFSLNWREGPSWRGKGLTLPELQRIHDNGLLVGVVFQHFNSNLKTFMDPGRPRFDAQRALDLAKELGQPSKTVIFFGADNHFDERQFRYVENYFRDLSPIIKAGGYRVGVYGEGYVCRMLKKAGHVSHCWLSQSIGPQFLESVAYERSKQWEIKQCGARVPYRGSGTDFDPDIVASSMDEIGF